MQNNKTKRGHYKLITLQCCSQCNPRIMKNMTDCKHDSKPNCNLYVYTYYVLTKPI